MFSKLTSSTSKVHIFLVYDLCVSLCVCACTRIYICVCMYTHTHIDLCHSKMIRGQIVPTQIQLYDIRMQDSLIEVDLHF